MSDIVERLSNPVSMSIFTSKDDMISFLLNERGEAADTITSLRSQLEEAQSPGPDADTRPRYSMKRMRDEIAKAKAYARAEALEEAAKVCEAEVSGITCDRFIFNGEVAKNDMGDTSFVSITRMSEYLRSQAASIRRLKEGR